MNICLCPMTQEMVRYYFQSFENDPDVYDDPERFQQYAYTEDRADAYWKRQQELSRIHLAVMLGDVPIDEVILKNIDAELRICTLSIHMQSDFVKNRGYGTQAENLTLDHAFNTLGMETVFADALIKNRRSCHVLEKVGFQLIRKDDNFCYYRCDKATWPGLEALVVS